MARKTKEELEKIKKKFGVNTLWSWSKYNTYKTDTYEYFLKYILHLKEDRTNGIYAVSGGYTHQIIEDFYNKKIEYKDMLSQYEDYLLTMNLAELKYNRNDNEKNEKIANKYKNCLRHFFENHQIIPFKNKIEHFIVININGIILQGYIDFLHIEKYKDNNGNEKNKVVITDWKTSTIYKGKKVEKECGQLVIYAEGIRQALKIPLEDIICRWNFLKYVSVKYLQANGKWKERQIERHILGESLINTVKMWLKKEGYEENEIEKHIENIVLKNDISSLPEEIKDKFVISDCYVEVSLSEERINELKDEFTSTIKEIEEKTKEYEKTKDENIFWQEVTQENEFYLSTLCGYSRKLHKPYDAYLKEKELFVDDEIQKDTEDNNNENDLLEFLNDL
ncbi:PD-(D/E)XK nuclease family protein [Anaerovorax sp. IOR16]|uniref:PD-(D/E)XK nuclease family protein n=1 Tax=Anaerovorax sp. IOR16 TaxID=2773458 RepID=UPI0019D132F8|nr:PD-(D/E)XK nuclease family protein [Anaerovorax sp. IOR16]